MGTGKLGGAGRRFMSGIESQRTEVGDQIWFWGVRLLAAKEDLECRTGVVEKGVK